jgi:hypothetical protein
MLRLRSGLLTLSPGKSGRCSCPETKTELAREKNHIEFMGIVNQFSLCFASHLASKFAALAYEPRSMDLCAIGHFAPKQNHKVLKKKKVN